MGFFQDISPIFKKRELTLLESYQEIEGVYTFVFEKEKDLNWKSGQHGIFTITHKSIKKPTRPFSVASTPAENVVKITMGIGENPSEFKQAMLELKQGMKISMRGPVGPMYLAEQAPILLIAGGIGITPFRAIFKEVEASSEWRQQVTLLFVDSNGLYVYKDELDKMADNPLLNVKYLQNRDELYKEIDIYIAQSRNQSKYFVAGSKSMVDAVSSYMKKQDILKKNIKKDAFIGLSN
ncbi:FAD-dependent oxidoreductase [Bacillus sp. HMF5848]|uniref:FAD-dependent oxidoreductase n=1 Tax=Bacillus sp. HMF5848 TaxID=2495421 RepID=UPI000F76A844|nr:FAD-dependent oxidoreductase [Bacillus sp. HMF5848]RSK25600.1 FAD-dependent oxidoreductase [Bacillus sp. HMF5848]